MQKVQVVVEVQEKAQPTDNACPYIWMGQNQLTVASEHAFWPGAMS